LTYDVAVVGAGSAGAAAALQGARRGLRVVCLEQRPLEAAGARWVNGIALWVFEAAGVARPVAPVLRGAAVPAHLVAGFGPERVVIQGHEMVEVDMRLFVACLQEEAATAGATFLGETRVLGWDGERLATSRGPIRTRFVVDASGQAGARLLGCPPVPGEHLCVAAQEVRRIRDAASARAFFARYEVPWGHTVSFAGIAGGFSTLHLRADGDEVGLLAGSVPSLGYPSGGALLERFASEQPWLGERLFGGGRAIPLRRPYDRLARGRVAALGDAACQVFSPTGCGVGAGLLAARLLAEALADGRGVAGYEADWHHQYGGLFGAVDLFRRFSQSLTLPETARLMQSGLLDPAPAADSLSQRLPRLRPAVLARLLRAAPRAPALALRMTRVLTRMAAVQALYRLYPQDPARQRAWSRRVAAVFGEAADELNGL
jgi:flavin-dependent dehydrogenase